MENKQINEEPFFAPFFQYEIASVLMRMFRLKFTTMETIVAELFLNDALSLERWYTTCIQHTSPF